MICVNPKCKIDLPDEAKYCYLCGTKLKKAERRQKTKSRGNGLGSVYKLPNGKWCAAKTLWYVADPVPEDAPPDAKPHKRRKVVRKQYSTRKDAMAALPLLGVANYRPQGGTPTQRKKTAITLKELYDQWEPTHNRGKSTMNCYRAGFRIFAPLWHVSMQDIDIDDLQNCMDESEAGRRTQENARAALGLIYKYGIPRDAIPKDRNLAPFLRIWEPGSRSTKEGFSVEELEKIRKATDAGDRSAARILCNCYLGYRPTGFLELKVADYNAKEKAFVGGIKTEAGINRAVTVSPKIQRYVDQYLAVAGNGYVFGVAGERLSIEDYREDFYAVLARLGIDNPVDEQGRHRLTPHSCRHTFATLMKRVKGSDTDKLALIGHTSTEQLRDYQDVSFEDLRAITDAM